MDEVDGHGPLADSFRQIVAGEQRPTLVARGALKAGGVVAVAWDGGKEASRAARTALPLLEKADKVVILTAGCGSGRPGGHPRPPARTGAAGHAEPGRHGRAG